MQEKNFPPESDAYSKFTASLPRNLSALKKILEWYDAQQAVCMAMLNNELQIVKIVFDADHEDKLPFGDYQELNIVNRVHECAYTTKKFFEKFLSHYNSTLYGEKLMLETFISEVELENKQRLWN